MTQAETAKPSLNLDMWPANSFQAWRDAPLPSFLAWLAEQKVLRVRQLRGTSCETYTAMFSAWVQFLERNRMHVLEASPGDTERFFQVSRMVDGVPKLLEPVSRRRYLQLLDRVYEHLRQVGLAPENPIVPELQKEGLLDIALPLGLAPGDQAQLQALLAKGAGVKGARDRGMAALMLGAGLRANELIDLSVTGVGAAYEVKVRPNGVHRAHTTLVLPDGPWREWHQAWLGVRREHNFPGDLLCPATPAGQPFSPSGLFRRVSSWLEGAGCQASQRGPNVLRNTFAQQALASGRYSVAQVQEFMGHAELRATARHQVETPSFIQPHIR